MTALLSFEPEQAQPLFDLVVATLWADGELADREIAAARGAQVALGLVYGARTAEIAIARGPTERWRQLARARERERMIAYAAAVWTALADARIDPGELRFLREVRSVLALDEAAVCFAEGLARWVDSTAREEAMPHHRAFALLLITGARRVERVRARHAAA